MKKQILLALAALAAMGIGETAAAAPPPTTVYGSPVVVAPAVTTQAATQVSGIIAERIASAVASVSTGSIIPGVSSNGAKMKGEAAGDKPSSERPSGWASASVSSIDKSDLGGEFDGKIYTGLLGADMHVNSRVMVGVALGTEVLDISTKFNNGSITSSSLSVAPYAAYKLTDEFTVLGSLGLSRHWYDIERNNNAVQGEVTGNRLFNSLELAYSRRISAWQLGANVGNLYIFERQDAYTDSSGTAQGETDIRLGQAHIGTRLGYGFKSESGTFTPYGALRAEYDYSHIGSAQLGNGLTAASDRFGITYGLGLEATLSDNVTLDVGGSAAGLRENLDLYTGTVTLRVRF